YAPGSPAVLSTNDPPHLHRPPTRAVVRNSLPGAGVRRSVWVRVPVRPKQVLVTSDAQANLVRRLGGPPDVSRLDPGAANEAVVMVPACFDQPELSRIERLVKAGWDHDHCFI